jgi:hypothetical protein
VVKQQHGVAALLRRCVPGRYRPIGYLTGLVRQRTDDRVSGGPFAGMRYPDRAINSAYLPKLLGSYERELNGVVEEVCALSPDVIIDVGAAEGYYAVGFARRNPKARVIAFEATRTGRSALERNARMNGVRSRVRVGGRCQIAELQNALGEGARAVVICDVEGDERMLLDPAIVRGLRNAWVLAETHEFVQPGVTEELRRRFRATHRVEEIWQQPRSAKEFPYRTLWTALLPRSYLAWAVSEWRPGLMSWLWMKPLKATAYLRLSALI